MIISYCQQTLPLSNDEKREFEADNANKKQIPQYPSMLNWLAKDKTYTATIPGYLWLYLSQYELFIHTFHDPDV